MRKLSIMLFAMVAFIATSNAQVIFGAKAGVNVANIASDDDTSFENGGGLDDPSSRVGFHAGLTGDMKISDAFGIGAELLYSQQGTQDEGTVLGTDYENEFKLDYINIPILAKVYVGESFNIYGGVQPGFVVGAIQIYTVGDTETEFDLKNEDENDPNKFGIVKDTDFSIPLGIGYRSPGGLSVDARYNIGTTAVFENQSDDSETVGKNRVLQVGIGFNF